MTKREKRIQKIIQNPKTVTFEEIDKLLIDAGFLRRQSSGGLGGHYGKEKKP